MLVSLCLCLVSVYMICLLLRVWCWVLPLLLCGMWCVRWALVKFLLWMWLPLHLEHKRTELRDYLDRFFLWSVWSVLPFLISLGWKSILFNIRMATPAFFLEPFAWTIIFQLLHWVNVCLCQWLGFPVMLGPVCISVY